MNPKPETKDTSLGTILVAMGVCTQEAVAWAAERQSRASQEQLLGMFLLDGGLVSKEQLKEALEVQAGLRSGRKHVRALAQAEIAAASTATVTSYAKHVKRKSIEVKRKTTGKGYPVVTRGMLDNGDK